MPIKFEGQFKYRDESKVNPQSARAAMKSRSAHPARIIPGSRDSVYPEVSPNDNHRHRRAWRGRGAAIPPAQ
jgi:hypothetical protein